MNTFQVIAQQISSVTGETFTLTKTQAVSGGDINRAYQLIGEQKTYFIKLNHTALQSMFAAEFAGLEALAATQTIRIPKPITYGQTDQQAFLALEYIPFGRASSNSDRLLGEQLAQLHQQPQAYFGWHCQNTIGSTPQHNHRQDNWLSFWGEQRVGFQLQLAAQNGYGGKLQTTGEQLISQLPAFFNSYQPQPSLLHGDLWGGNTGVDCQGKPLIFDPACYFGDREADIAMTELFGGFGRDFYTAYQSTWALDPGYNTRKYLYNLYHILNHLNLFGSSYLRQAEQMISKLLAEVA